jgi:electron transfer flavoprotein beta subunit
MPNFAGKMKAKKTEIPILTASDIGADEESIGLKGSPTRVVKIFRPQVGRSGTMVSTAEDLEGAVNGLVDFFEKKSII